MLKNLKIISINFFVLLAIFISLEYFARIVNLISKCAQNKDCIPKRALGSISPGPQLGLSKRDSLLGYIPKGGFNSIINYEPSWNNKLVTVEEYGIRKSSTQKISGQFLNVLTVGDSFAFGDQVSNDETWQSCLNLKQKKYNFINAGVFGYGTGQAYLRSQILAKKISPKPKFIILSHLVGHDFPRDKFKFRSGFPTPSLVSNKGTTFMTAPPSDNVVGTKYFKPKTNLDFFEVNLKKVLGNSRVLAKFNNYYQSVAQKRVSIQHPKAASEDEIRKWIILNSQKSPTKIIWLLQYSEKLYKEEEFITKKCNNNFIII